MEMGIMAIEDFGKKIGGARKDLWAARGLRIEDLEDFNVAERDKYIKKNNIWIKPDYDKLLSEGGYSRNALYFIKMVRDAIPTGPELSYMDTAEDVVKKQDEYIKFLSEFKEKIMEVRTDYDIDNIGISYLADQGYVERRGNYSSSWSVTDKGDGIITNKFFKALQMSSSQASREAQRKQFLADNIETIRSMYQILPMNYQCEIREDVGKDRLMVIQHRGGGSKTFYYPEDDDTNKILQLMKGKGISLNGWHLVVKNNYINLIVDNEESAKNYINDVVALYAKSKEEIEKAKKEGKEAGKADSDRKKGLTPPILAHIHRTGPEMRVGNVEGEDFLKDFNIKGGEFGNWLNEAERQTNMNMAYDSFKDMAKALGINDSDIALGGKLSIAFGSRGRKGAAAHYEPMREVINLTKMKGAGSLAHELFHAMDDIAGKEMGFGDFATAHEYKDNAFAQLVRAMKYKEVTLSVEELNKEQDEKMAARIDKFKAELLKMVPDRRLTPELIEQRDKLINDLFEKIKDEDFKFREADFGKRGKVKFIINEAAIKDICDFIDENSQFYKMTPNNKNWLCSNLESIQGAYHMDRITEPVTRQVETEFYKNSKKMDESWSKTTNGYWHSNIEMAARAFACYLHDKLAEMGIKNDYLTGHAFQVGLNANGETIPVYPSKEEREFINKAFDKVIEEMKTLGIFNQREENELAAEAADKFIVAKSEHNRVAITMYDKNYNEIGTASMLPDVPLEKALAAAALGKEIQIMDYSVFEAKKAVRQEELQKEAQQKALQESMNIPIIDPASCKQMTFDDVIAAAKTTRVNVEKPKATLQEKQFEIIQQTNPMRDDYHVGIRSVEDIKTFEEAFNIAMKDEESFQYGDFDELDAAKALRTGMITVYSSKPIEQGGFVSTSYNMAKDYAGSGRVYAERVSINDVAWINGDEGQFAKVPEREIQREEPSKSERKSGREDER